VKRGLLALLLAALACGGSPPQTELLREAMALAGAPPASAIAFRIPARRGSARLYDLPGLLEVAARLDPGPGAERPLGFATDDDLLYALASGNLVALDLRIGRFRTLDSNVVAAAMGATGTLVLAHADGDLAVASDRRVSAAGRLPSGSRLEQLWSTQGGRTVVAARGDSGRRLLVYVGGAETARYALPDGPLARTRWGDAVAVASVEAIELRELMREGASLEIPLTENVTALAFSASGHRLYVATDAPMLRVYERYDGGRLGAFPLPGPVTALRPDHFGRYVFGVTGETVLVLDLAADTIITSPGDWDDDLPAAGADGTILMRRGADVVAVSLRDTAPRGIVKDGARDRWVVAAWSGQPQMLALEPTVTTGGAVPSAGQEIFVQVSSTSNAQWAEGLAADLRLAGMRATVLPPTTADEMFRVVLGPYPTREEAETIGRKLGMPYWIFQRDTASAPRTTP
jgi:hypothetical protein